MTINGPTEMRPSSAVMPIEGLSLFDKHKLVTTGAASTGFQSRERESLGPIKIEDLLRFGYLERISADPVNKVVPDRHTTTFFVVRPALERQRVLESRQAPHGGPELEIGAKTEQHAKPQWPRRFVIESFDDLPKPACATLV